MPKPDPESQTPSSKILLPLGTAFIILAVSFMVLLDLGPVSSIMAIVLIVAGVGIIWQGIKNIKRDKA